MDAHDFYIYLKYNNPKLAIELNAYIDECLKDELARIDRTNRPKLKMRALRYILEDFEEDIENQLANGQTVRLKDLELTLTLNDVNNPNAYKYSKTGQYAKVYVDYGKELSGLIQTFDVKMNGRLAKKFIEYTKGANAIFFRNKKNPHRGAVVRTKLFFKK